MIESRSNEIASGITDINDIAGFRTSFFLVDDVRKYPRVTSANKFVFVLADKDAHWFSGIVEILEYWTLEIREPSITESPMEWRFDGNVLADSASETALSRLWSESGGIYVARGNAVHAREYIFRHVFLGIWLISGKR